MTPGADRRDGLSRPRHRPGDGTARACRAGPFRWWIAASNRSGSCSRESESAPLHPARASARFGARTLDAPAAVPSNCTGPRSAPATDRRSDRRPATRRTGRARRSGPPPTRRSPRSMSTASSARSPMARRRSRARAKAQTATVTVRVKDAHAPFTWSFRNHVIPVMTKMGCNQGACHGALAGKNGFKLTLRGYDPDVDYDTLTRQSVGRRVVAGRSRGQPDSAQAVLRHSARRRQAVRPRTRWSTA